MNVRDRLLNTIQGKRADRVPINLDGFLYNNREQIDKLSDAGRREVAHRIFKHQAVFVEWPSCINRYLITPGQFIKHTRQKDKDGNVTLTAEINTPKGKLTAVTGQNALSNTTWTIKYPVESMEDIEKIRSVPWELPKGLAPPDLSKLPDDFRERRILQTRISSPFVCVAGMMPYEDFLGLCATDLPLVEELTELCKQRTLDVLDVLLREKNIDYVWVGGSEWVTPPMASPRIYEALVQEQEREVIAHIHEAGAVCHVHCHGNVRRCLEMVVDRGADFFEPVEPPPDGDIEFAEAKAVAAGRMTLGGNLEVRILENESADVVEEATHKCFEGSRERMVLKATEAPMKTMSPETVANYHRVIDIWEELSSF
ncbi:MAG: uroporphyrinogen decarboxylase family protein [Planctomycetota bacterium]